MLKFQTINDSKERAPKGVQVKLKTFEIFFLAEELGILNYKERRDASRNLNYWEAVTWLLSYLTRMFGSVD